MEHILNSWNEHSEYKDLAGCKNDCGDSGMLLAVKVDSEAGYMWCCNEKVVRNEIKITNNSG